MPSPKKRKWILIAVFWVVIAVTVAGRGRTPRYANMFEVDITSDCVGQTEGARESSLRVKGAWVS